MSQSKSIVLASLFCLFFCTTQLYALEPDRSNLKKQEAAFSLDGIFKSLDGAVNGLGNALDETINGLGNALDGSVSGLGYFIGGAANGLGTSLDEAWMGLGDLLEDTGEAIGEVAEVALVVGLVFLYVTAEANCYQYDYGHHNGHNHSYHR
jgi:hypothetical protein